MTPTMRRKRLRSVRAKAGELIAAWGMPSDENSPDIVYAWGASGACKSDSMFLADAFENVKTTFGRALREELEYRGYDLTTWRFSIRQKEGTNA